MKAAVLHAQGDIRYGEWATPEVSPGDVLIKVRATGICGSDIPRVLGGAAHHYPIVLGHEFAGEVARVGADVTRVKVGDRATGAPLIPCFQCEDCQRGDYSQCKHYSFIGSRQQGSYAEFLCLPERHVVRFDANVDFAQGAFFEPSTVALHANTSAASIPLAMDAAIKDGRIKRGDLVVIEAMGGGLTWGACAFRL